MNDRYDNRYDKNRNSYYNNDKNRYEKKMNDYDKCDNYNRNLEVKKNENDNSIKDERISISNTQIDNEHLTLSPEYKKD